MILRKRVISLLLVLVCYGNAFKCQAQKAPPNIDYLTPVDGYFSSYQHINEYYSKLREVLYTDPYTESIRLLARVVGIPTFYSEYVLSIEETDNHYYLIYNLADDNIFSSSSLKLGEKVAFSTRKAAISEELALSISRLFNTAIQQVKYPPTAPRTGFDGTRFIFITSQQGIGIRAGQTWSPIIGTDLGALVEIVNHLQSLAISPTDQVLQQKLIKEVKQLDIKLHHK